MQNIKKYAIPAAFVALLVFIDQWTKWLAIRHLAPLDAYSPARDNVLVEGFLRLTFLQNHGMAFGLMEGARWLFIALTVVVVAVLLYFYKTTPKDTIGRLCRIALLLLIGGALGNFIDRLFRGGGVVDFIAFEFNFFPFVFNFADVFVVVGVFSLMPLTFFIKDEKKDAKKS